MIGGKIADEGQMSVPTFYADEDDSDWMVESATSSFGYLVAVIFGALHLAGWNFFFQFPIERDIWRVASIIITAVAAVAFISNIFGLIRRYYIEGTESLFFYILSRSISYLASFSLSLYLPTRLVLLVEALFLLKDLPPGVFVVVQWTLFIPHV